MALNPKLLNFFINRISNSTIESFGGETNHLFEHLSSEVKNNPIFDKYESQLDNWKNWEGSSAGNWIMPPHFEDAKALSYYLYKEVATLGDRGYNIPIKLTYDRYGDINTAISNFNNQFLNYLELVLEEILRANPEIESTEIVAVKGNTVFIIHGHDNLIKTEVQLLLHRAGVHNLVLHEQSDRGRTIIDKLIEESSGANYAIALLSPDDTLHDGKNRARQNVILELGYFMGKLGKERVRLIKKGDIDIPSDLQGILYENYDENGIWKLKLLKQLNAVGIYVDMNVITKTL